MTRLEDRLRALGDVLDIDRPDLADAVLARLDETDDDPSGEATGRVARWVRVAAVAATAMAVSVAIVPSSRSAVADWLGFDGADVERRPDLEVPVTPDPLDRAPGTLVTVDGTEVLVSEFIGSLDTPAVSKTVGDGSAVVEVEVGGAPALWIEGDPHEVAFLDADGEVVVERFAGNTLLWQDGRVIRRVEGFDDVDAAIDLAESVGT